MTHAVSVADDPIRDRLVAAAAEVFAEKGYDGARVQEIALRAGLTTGAIYGRFTGKAQLLQAAIEHYSTSELDDLFASHGFEGRVTDILTTVGAHLVTRPHESARGLLLEAFVAARRDPEVAAIVRRHLEDRASRLAALVAEAKATGLVEGELDDLAVVRFCHALGLGFLLFEAVDLPRPAAEPWEDLVDRMVAAFAHDPRLHAPIDPRGD